MNIERYPTSLAVTAQDLMSSGWKAALDGTTRDGYSSMWQALSVAARRANEEGRQSHGKVLWLLADACSMMLVPKSNNEPFSPFFVSEEGRSVIPDDLDESDLVFFSQIVDLVDDVWLKARIAELVWLRKRNLGSKFALDAIDAYMAIPLDANVWVYGGRECWERAIRLCLTLQKGSGNRISAIESALLSVFDAATSSDGYWAVWLAGVLAEHGLGRAKREHIASKLIVLAQEFVTVGDLHRARDYFESSCGWYQKCGDTAKCAEATVKCAESWVKEATAQMAAAAPSHLAAASFLEKAIQKYRAVPRRERAVHKVDERIAELHRRMNDAGSKSLGEMQTITTSNADITEIVEKARQAVTDKPVLEALGAFANIYPGVRYSKIRADAENGLRQNILSQLFGATYLSRDGRVIAKRAAAGFDQNDPDDNHALWVQMVRNYQILINIVVEGDIWPAHAVLIQEHRLRETDFISLTSRSPIVPIGRQRLFAKALFLGYEQDFVAALHILVPQIEHMVRIHLKNAGAKTSNLDKDGIENENGLSTLVDLPETAHVFGDDIAFELKALFCSAFGANLRNELAHGLLDYEACHSPAAIYAWWFAFKLMFNTFWNASGQASGEGVADTRAEEE